MSQAFSQICYGCKFKSPVHVKKKKKKKTTPTAFTNPAARGRTSFPRCCTSWSLPASTAPRPRSTPRGWWSAARSPPGELIIVNTVESQCCVVSTAVYTLAFWYPTSNALFNKLPTELRRGTYRSHKIVCQTCRKCACQVYVVRYTVHIPAEHLFCIPHRWWLGKQTSIVVEYRDFFSPSPACRWSWASSWSRPSWPAAPQRPSSAPCLVPRETSWRRRTS